MPQPTKPEATSEMKMDKDTTQTEKLREALVATAKDVQKTLDAVVRARQVTQEDLRVEFSV